MWSGLVLYTEWPRLCCCGKMKYVIHTRDHLSTNTTSRGGFETFHFRLRKFKTFKQRSLHQVRVSLWLEWVILLSEGLFLFISCTGWEQVNMNCKFQNGKQMRSVWPQICCTSPPSNRRVSKDSVILSNFEREEPAEKCVFILLSAYDSYLTLVTHWLHTTEQLRASQYMK